MLCDFAPRCPFARRWSCLQAAFPVESRTEEEWYDVHCMDLPNPDDHNGDPDDHNGDPDGACSGERVSVVVGVGEERKRVSAGGRVDTEGPTRNTVTTGDAKRRRWREPEADR